MRGNKTIVAAIFSMVVAVAMAAIPTNALAHDWDHGGGPGWGREDNPGLHRGWGDHGRWGGGPPGWQNNRWGRGDNDGDEGYNNGYGYGGYSNPYAYGSYNRPLIPGTIDGMVNPRNPRLRWMCDGGGHHCHWAPNPAANLYNYSGYNGYNGYNNNYYGNGYNGYYGQSPAMNAIGAIAGPMLGIPIP